MINSNYFRELAVLCPRPKAASCIESSVMASHPRCSLSVLARRRAARECGVEAGECITTSNPSTGTTAPGGKGANQAANHAAQCPDQNALLHVNVMFHYAATNNLEITIAICSPKLYVH